MKPLPFKLSEQEKQAIKKAGQSQSFKSFQKEIVIYLCLLALAFVFLWQYSKILIFLVVAMAVIIAARYGQTFRSSKETRSIGEKVEKEIKRQQESTKKIALPIIFGMIAVFVLFLVGLTIYVLYLKPISTPEPEPSPPPFKQEPRPSAKEEISISKAKQVVYEYAERVQRGGPPTDSDFEAQLDDWISENLSDIVTERMAQKVKDRGIYRRTMSSPYPQDIEIISSELISPTKVKFKAKHFEAAAQERIAYYPTTIFVVKDNGQYLIDDIVITGSRVELAQ